MLILPPDIDILLDQFRVRAQLSVHSVCGLHSQNWGHLITLKLPQVVTQGIAFLREGIRGRGRRIMELAVSKRIGAGEDEALRLGQFRQTSPKETRLIRLDTKRVEEGPRIMLS